MSQRMTQQKQQERNDESEMTARRHECVRELARERLRREIGRGRQTRVGDG